MPRYRTQFIIPPDRYVCLQIPAHFPAGLATVTVHFGEPPSQSHPPAVEGLDIDRDDIEWWDEFDDPEAAG